MVGGILGWFWPVTVSVVLAGLGVVFGGWVFLDFGLS